MADVITDPKKIEKHIAPKLRGKTIVKSVIIKDSAKLHEKAQGKPLGKPRPMYLGSKGNPCMSIKR